MKKKNKGFTLIELVIVLAVMSILGVIITSVLSSTLKTNANQTDKLALQDNATTIQRVMKADIRRATVIVANDTSTTIPSDYTNRLYIETITNKKMYYAFKDGQVWKINLDTADKMTSPISLGKYINTDGFLVDYTGGYINVTLNLIKNSSDLKLKFRAVPVKFGG